MPRAVITGAFSYTGSAVAAELQRRGWELHTLTNRRTPEGVESITAAPLRFEREHLVAELSGADAFVNTFWIRLPHAGQDFGTAVEHSKLLVGAATEAGVGRLVHVSVSNASVGSELGYYRGKGHVEQSVRACGLSHAIVRPTLIVGANDVLTANIAWFLRHGPFFPIPGGGHYRLQPITLADAGRVIADAVEAGEDLEIDAAGPVTLSFRDYVRWVARACGVRRWIVGTPAWLCLAALRVVGAVLGDVVLTREELLGLEQELLVSHAPPLGSESVEELLMTLGPGLGRHYVNDLRRHFGEGANRPLPLPSSAPGSLAAPG